MRYFFNIDSCRLTALHGHRQHSSEAYEPSCATGDHAEPLIDELEQHAKVPAFHDIQTGMQRPKDRFAASDLVQATEAFITNNPQVTAANETKHFLNESQAYLDNIGDICENWPKAAYEERDSVNPPPGFCPICIQSQRRQCCMWAKTEPVGT